jgi:protein-tyrosine phosphatase
MDDENLRNVQRLAKGTKAHAQVFPLLHFASDVNNIREVPDPYLVGGFDIVYRLVNAGCSGLLEHIRREHQLPPATSSTRLNN